MIKAFKNGLTLLSISSSIESGELESVLAELDIKGAREALRKAEIEDYSEASLRSVINHLESAQVKFETSLDKYRAGDKYGFKTEMRGLRKCLRPVSARADLYALFRARLWMALLYIRIGNLQLAYDAVVGAEHYLTIYDSPFQSIAHELMRSRRSSNLIHGPLYLKDKLLDVRARNKDLPEWGMFEKKLLPYSSAVQDFIKDVQKPIG